MKNVHRINKYILITNDEEIKEGDWCYYENVDLRGVHRVVNGQRPKTMLLKKIILTTDQSLIADGVQAIDDEFLEWFVKNPSCEEVKVEKVMLSKVEGTSMVISKYKIILPKEETKDLAYWRTNAEEDYMRVPISVLRYISELESRMYSEGEVLELLHKRMIYTFEDDYQRTTTTKWFEQFKKN